MPAMTARARRRQRGGTLVELVVASILVAIAVSAMVGVVLQGSGQRAKMRRREQGMLQAGQVLNDLKNYVTSDASAATAASAPGGCWNFKQGATCTAGWALSTGDHDVTFLLPQELRDPPINATLNYTVSEVGGPGGPRAVSARFDWQEPP